VIRWLAILFVALLVLAALRPWLEKIGLGRLPGDLHFRFAGRDWHVPLASTVLLSVVAMLIAKIL
jgi:Protein of unknown function (DUF2905)